MGFMDTINASNTGTSTGTNAGIPSGTGYTVKGFGTQRPTHTDKLTAKTGGKRISYATYREVGSTCVDCGLIDSGCYAQQFRCAENSKRAGTRTFDPVEWVEGLPYSVLVRWNVTGDIMGEDGETYREAIKVAHESRDDVDGWLYTHGWKRDGILEWAQSLPSNVTAIASADTEHDAMLAFDKGFSTTAVVGKGNTRGKWDRETAAAFREEWQVIADTWGVPLVICPAERDKGEAGKPVGCADCLACTKPGLIGFPAHGPARNKASAALAEVREDGKLHLRAA